MVPAALPPIRACTAPAAAAGRSCRRGRRLAFEVLPAVPECHLGKNRACSSRARPLVPDTTDARCEAALEMLGARHPCMLHGAAWSRSSLNDRPLPLQAVAGRSVGSQREHQKETFLTPERQQAGNGKDSDPILQEFSAAKAAFSRIYERGEWLCGGTALSGLGSSREGTREFCLFLGQFLAEHGVRSVVDAGCGHWPSGYQRFVPWAGVEYHGVDVVPQVVNDNSDLLSSSSELASHRLKRAQFSQGSVTDTLPAADLLLVKDVLMHLPNADIHRFLEQHISPQGRFKAVMLVQNDPPPSPVSLRQLLDIEAGQLLPFDVRQPPFSAPFEEVFRWQSDATKTVLLWRRSE